VGPGSAHPLTPIDLPKSNPNESPKPNPNGGKPNPY
jgi:hypothetical protein